LHSVLGAGAVGHVGQVIADLAPAFFGTGRGTILRNSNKGLTEGYAFTAGRRVLRLKVRDAGGGTPDHLQSSSSSRRTAGASWFLILSHAASDTQEMLAFFPSGHN
jgi:hypothetical protein